MYKTQDQETALLREELSKLLTTLKHNREKVPLDVLKTKYKKGYDTLCVSIKRSASDYAKRTALCGIRIHEDYLDEAAAVINGTIERCGRRSLTAWSLSTGNILGCISRRNVWRIRMWRRSFTAR